MAWISAAIEALATGSVFAAMVGAAVVARRFFPHPEQAS